MPITASSEIIRTAKYECYLIDNEIIYFHYFEDAVIDIREIMEGISLHDEFGVDETIYRIIHSDKYATITKEAREFVENYARPAKAEAYVIPGLAQKILFNLYIKFRRRKHPIKAFENLNDAIAWLRSNP